MTDIVTSKDLLADAARRRGITVTVWEDIDPDIYWLEDVASGQRHAIRYTNSDVSGHVTYLMCANKELMSRLLVHGGFPVPRSQLVDSVAEAEQCLTEYGRMVIKPMGNTGGTAVRPDIRRAEEIPAAFAAAQAANNVADAANRVICQAHVEGNDYRLLVIRRGDDDYVVYSVQRIPAAVTGDGQHTVAELVALVNAERQPAYMIRLDGATDDNGSNEVASLLAEQAVTVDSVPAVDQVVRLARVANAHAGGTVRDVTDEVHADVRQLAINVARYCNVPLVGIDWLSPDIGQIDGSIIELNATPDLMIHHFPHEGEARLAAEAVMDMLFSAKR